MKNDLLLTPVVCLPAYPAPFLRGWVRKALGGTLLLWSLALVAQGQNVGVGIATPQAKLDINGDLALRKGADIVLVNGSNDNVSIDAYSFFRLTGPTTAFTLTGLSGGKDGKLLTLVNASTQSMTLAHENAASAATNRLNTSSGSDLAVAAGTAVSLVYDETAQRWQVTAVGADSGNTGWSLQGNAGTDPATRFVGTTDAQDVSFRTNNQERMRLTQQGSLWLNALNDNVLIGYQAGNANTTGALNQFVGYQAGLSNTTGQRNHFVGFRAGNANTTGSYNYFVGHGAGDQNTSGSNNHFEGFLAGSSTTTGSNNHFEGHLAGRFNTIGTQNQFIGHQAGLSNTTGTHNHFVGYRAGHYNTTGNTNHFEGYNSGFSNSTGEQNQFIGYQAGLSNITGNFNHFVGFRAGNSNTIGSFNHFAGHGAGDRNTSGEQNQFIGYQAGSSNTTGHFNHFEGFQAGLSNTTGQGNHFVGFRAGNSNTIGSGNHFAGYGAGDRNTSGEQNQFIGFLAGSSNTTGKFNHFEGFQAGLSNTTGERNYFVGFRAGNANTTGSYNHFAGYGAGDRNTTGAQNHFEGYFAGLNNITGSRNTLIGHQADVLMDDLTNATAIGYGAKVSQSNTLVLGGIGNNAVKVGIGTTVPARTLTVDPNGTGGILIGKASPDGYTSMELFVSAASGGYAGIQSIKSAGIEYGDLILNEAEGKVGIGLNNPGYQLHVNGSVAGIGAYVNASDLRYKRNIATLNGALGKVMRLRGVSYHWREEEFPRLHFGEQAQLGFIAQELKEVLPEVVTQDGDGYYSVAYSQVIPVLVEALKELKAENDALQTRNQRLQQRQEELDERLRRLESLLNAGSQDSSSLSSGVSSASGKQPE